MTDINYICFKRGGIEISVSLFVFKEGDHFFSDFDVQSLKEQLVMRPDPEAMDYRMVFTNKQRKLYDGQKVTLHAYMEQNGIEAYGARTFTMGTLLDPIAVHDSPHEHIRLIAMSLVIGLVLVGLLYLFFGFLFPKWRFGIFKKRYVKRFEKPNVLPTRAPIQYRAVAMAN